MSTGEEEEQQQVLSSISSVALCSVVRAGGSGNHASNVIPDAVHVGTACKGATCDMGGRTSACHAQDLLAGRGWALWEFRRFSSERWGGLPTSTAQADRLSARIYETPHRG